MTTATKVDVRTIAPPTLTATADNPTFTNTAVDLFDSVAITAGTGDVDKIRSVVLSVSGLADGADEKISFAGTSISLTNGNTGSVGPVNYSVAVAGSVATLTLANAVNSEAVSSDWASLLDGFTAYNNTSANPTAGNRVVTLTQLTDKQGEVTNLSGVSSTVTVAANPAPVIGGSTTSTTINDTATATPFSAVTITDTDNVTVSVTLDTEAKGVFTSASLTASGFTSAGGGVYNLASGTAAAAQAAIRQLVFDPTDNRVAPATTEMTTFTISVNDGVNTAVTNNTTTVTSTSVNDSPTLTNVTWLSGATEDTAFEITYATLLAQANEADVDPGTTLSFRVESVTTGNLYTDSALTTAVIPGTTLLSTGGSWYWKPAADANGVGSGALNAFTIKAWDGTTASATAVQLQVNTDGVNDAPVIDLNAAAGGSDNSATFAAGGSAVNIANSDATLVDVDSSMLSSMTVTLTSRPDGDGVEGLALNNTAQTYANSAHLTVGYTAATGVLSITGSATTAVYQTILRGVTYTNTDSVTDATPGVRSVTVVARDSADNSVTRTSTVTVEVPPTITSATYDATNHVLTVTGTNFPTVGGLDNDINVSKLSVTGEGGTLYQLTSPDVEITSASSFSVTLNAADQATMGPLLNKAGGVSTGGTTYNLAAATGWALGYGASPSDLLSNPITVGNLSAPSITSFTYNAATGVLAASGSGFLSLAGANNDIDVAKFTFMGEGSATYTLTGAQIEVTNDSAFSIQLNATDRAAVGAMANKDGTEASDGTAYNVSAGEGWARGAGSPSITNEAYYDRDVNIRFANGQNIVLDTEASDTIDQVKAKIQDETGASASGISLSWDGRLLEDGRTLSDYNIQQARGPILDALLGVDLTTPVVVSSTPVPALTSATYDSATGVLVVSGTGFVTKAGANNDIDISKLRFTGQGGAGATYTLTSASDVDITSATSFTVTLSGADKTAVDALLNKTGTSANDNTVYILGGLEDWAAGADASVDVADEAGNGITVNAPARSLSYSSSTFSETAANNGSITATSTLTLTNDTFTGAVGDPLGTVTNVPAGLIASLVKASATTATLSFTGSASAHANADDVSNLSVTFTNGDFTGGSVAAVTGANRSDLVIDFADPTIPTNLIVTSALDTNDDTTFAASLAADIADGGGLSLREALNWVQDNGTIGFSAGLNGQTITLGSNATVKTGVTLDVDAVGSLTITGSTLQLAGDLNITHASGDSLTIGSSLADATGASGSVVKQGVGTLTLSGTNSYSGTTVINAGTLAIASDANLGTDYVQIGQTGATVDATNRAVLHITGTGAQDFNNVLMVGSSEGEVEVDTGLVVTLNGKLDENPDGSGRDLIKTGGGTLILASPDNEAGLSGDIFIEDGDVQVADDDSIPAGEIYLAEGKEMEFTGDGETNVDNPVNLNGDANFNVASADKVVTISGEIKGGAGNDFIQKGSGTLKLTGNSTFSGATKIDSGTFLLNGSLANTSNVSVNGKLGGSGSIGTEGSNGSVTINSGGTLAAGNSPGILTLNNGLTLTTGAKLDVELNNATAGTGHDQVVVKGAVNLTGSTLVLKPAANLAEGTSFKIIDNDGTDAVTGTFANLAQGSTFTQGGQSFSINYAGGDGNDVVLTRPHHPSADTRPSAHTSTCTDACTCTCTQSHP